MTNRIIFGLGSNLGDRNNYLNQAILLLTAKLNLINIKRSKTLANKALLKENSSKEWDLEFLNIAISADIDLAQFPPLSILAIIKEIETNLGRNQTAPTWSPRQIDIDILAIDKLKIDLGDTLQIPHLQLFKREFFLITVDEIENNLLRELTI